MHCKLDNKKARNCLFAKRKRKRALSFIPSYPGVYLPVAQAMEVAQQLFFL